MSPKKAFAFFTLLLCLTCLICAGIVGTSNAKETATLLPMKAREKGINNLTLDSQQIAFGMDKKGQELMAFLSVPGTFQRKNWKLLDSNKKAVAIVAQFKFNLKIPIKGETVSFRLFAVGPSGEIETQNFVIEVSEVEEFYEKNGRKKAEKPSKPDRRAETGQRVFFLNFGTSATYSSYSESIQDRPSRYRSLLLTLKGGAAVKVFEKLDLGVGGFFTALPILKSTSATGRYLGINFRAGFWVPLWDNLWQLGILAGYYFTTMYVNTSEFGYRDVGGPQLFPVFRRKFNNNSSFSFYLKYSPVSNRLALLKLSSREIAAGASYGLPNSSLSLNLDISDLRLDLPQLDSFRAVNQTFSLGVSFNF